VCAVASLRGLICKDPINMGNALFQLPLKIVMDKPTALEVNCRTHTHSAGPWLTSHCAPRAPGSLLVC
jgi:hypothetical protein